MGWVYFSMCGKMQTKVTSGEIISFSFLSVGNVFSPLIPKKYKGFTETVNRIHRNQWL